MNFFHCTHKPKNSQIWRRVLQCDFECCLCKNCGVGQDACHTCESWPSSRKMNQNIWCQDPEICILACIPQGSGMNWRVWPTDLNKKSKSAQSSPSEERGANCRLTSLWFPSQDGKWAAKHKWMTWKKVGIPSQHRLRSSAKLVMSSAKLVKHQDVLNLQDHSEWKHMHRITGSIKKCECLKAKTVDKKVSEQLAAYLKSYHTHKSSPNLPEWESCLGSLLKNLMLTLEGMFKQLPGHNSSGTSWVCKKCLDFPKPSFSTKVLFTVWARRTFQLRKMTE